MKIIPLLIALLPLNSVLAETLAYEPAAILQAEAGKAPANAPMAGISALLVYAEKLDRMFLVDILKDGAAERAGLVSKDQIVQIDSTKIAGMDIFTVFQMLSGAPGSVVQLTVNRPGCSHPLVFNVTREFGQLPASGDSSELRASLIGKWQDENSVFQFNTDGTTVNDRPGMHWTGHWRVEKDVLKVSPPVYTGLIFPDNRIITATPNEFVVEGVEGGRPFHAKRIK